MALPLEIRCSRPARLNGTTPTFFHFRTAASEMLRALAITPLFPNTSIAVWYLTGKMLQASHYPRNFALQPSATCGHMAPLQSAKQEPAVCQTPNTSF